MKETYQSIQEYLRGLPENYPKSFLFLVKHQKIWKLYNKLVGIGINKSTKNSDDLYILIRKFYDNYIKDSKRKKINVLETVWGWRKKRYSAMFGIPPETHMYEYLSQLIHFRFLSIIYENHYSIQDNIIKDSEKFFALIESANIEQQHKDLRLSSYLRFTCRIIDLQLLNLEKGISSIPEIYGQEKLDIFAFNKALIDDNIRMNNWFTVT